MLTDTEIRRSKPAEQPYKLADGGGLYLLVVPTGGKLWRWKYRYAGKEKLMGLGRYPDVPLALARERHLDARRLLAARVDPMAIRMAEKASAKSTAEASFATIADLWLDHWRVGKSPRHADVTRRRIKDNILPILGTRPIGEIEASELVMVVKAIEARGVGDLARRALQTLGQIFRYAVAHGYAKRNPAADVKPSDILKQTTKTNLARVDAKDLPALLRAIEVYQGSHITRLALKLMALTFVRTTELIGARWEEIDIENGRWNIPAARMKMRSPHIVPLSRQAVEVVEMLRTLTGTSKWMFPGAGPKNPYMSNNTLLKGLKIMGYHGMMTGHGFRGLASTVLHEQGYDHKHIELQLAHSERNKVSASYNHALYLEPRARMMQDWGTFLELTQRGGKLLPFWQAVA